MDWRFGLFDDASLSSLNPAELNPLKGQIFKDVQIAKAPGMAPVRFLKNAS